MKLGRPTATSQHTKEVGMQMTKDQERQHKMKTRECIYIIEKDKTADNYDSDKELEDKILLLSSTQIHSSPMLL